MRQRSEQKGRQGLDGAKSAGFPHAGQATARPAGLALVILLFRVRRTVMADHLDLLKG